MVYFFKAEFLVLACRRIQQAKGSGLTPLNPIHQDTQTLALGGIDGLDEGNATFKVRSKVRVALAVLALVSVPKAVRERCLEPVDIDPNDIWVAVGDKSGDVLTHSLAHDARLAMVDVKSFFREDGSHLQ